MSPRMLWVGDAVRPTGFARVTHNVCDSLRSAGWDVHVLGINYDGDPHPYPYPIYPAVTGGDVFGKARLGPLARHLKPDVVLILQDPWIVSRMIETDVSPDLPMTAYMPVDGKNMPTAPQLNSLSCAIWYTAFGQREAEHSGYTGKSAVIPHGVDTSIYYPGDRKASRARLGLSMLGDDAFIFSNINRNAPRKRLDLTLQVFTQWWEQAGRPDNAYLFLHCSRTDIGYDIVQLARYYGIAKRVIFSKMDYGVRDSVQEVDLAHMYRASNVGWSTTMGEGWGLTTHEGMACGLAQILPRHSAYEEWCNGAVEFVPCDTVAVTPKGINVIGAVPSVPAFVAALDRAYRDKEWCTTFGALAYDRATDPKFQWSAIGAQFDRTLRAVLKGSSDVYREEQTADERTRQASNSAQAIEA